MGKPIKQTNTHSGNNYEILPYFLYEVTIYEICKNKVRLLCSKYYRSNKQLKIKSFYKSIKLGNKLIIRDVSLIGVPYGYENK